jgi:hypothetical protein
MAFVISTLGATLITFYYRRYVVWEQSEAWFTHARAVKVRTKKKLWLGMSEPQALRALGLKTEPPEAVYNPPTKQDGNYTMTGKGYIVTFRHGVLDDAVEAPAPPAR